MRQLVRHFSPELGTFVAASVLLLIGVQAPTTRYLSPESGLGYALGIAGGSMMLLLLVYPARKRFRSLQLLGSVPGWFRAHMILGVAGPVCILFHSNFTLGATNSNVALMCMLVVAGSGVVGRYFYSKIHHGLFGRKATLAELHAEAMQLKAHNPALPMLPELIARIELEEQSLLDTRGLQSVTAFALFAIPLRAWRARRRLRRYVRLELGAAASRSQAIAAQRTRIERVVLFYVAKRIGATRRVVELGVFERLFSLWHILHLPLFFMLLVSGTVHVVAVHIY